MTPYMSKHSRDGCPSDLFSLNVKSFQIKSSALSQGQVYTWNWNWSVHYALTILLEWPMCWHTMGCLQSFRKLILLGLKLADFNWNVSITWWYAVHPVSAVDAGGVVDLPLAEVDQVGVEEDAHRHQDDQQPQLLVGLLQGVKQWLKASKVTDKFEYSKVKVSILSLVVWCF